MTGTTRLMLWLAVLGGALLLDGAASGSARHIDVGCAVSNSGIGIDGPFVWAGNDAPGNQTCHYQAQRPAGYRGVGLWKVTVSHGNKTTEYTAGVSPACSATGVIQPGDYVQVTTQVAPVVGVQTGVSRATASPTTHC